MINESQGCDSACISTHNRMSGEEKSATHPPLPCSPPSPEAPKSELILDARAKCPLTTATYHETVWRSGEKSGIALESQTMHGGEGA